MYQKYINMFDMTKDFIYEYAKFGVYFGVLAFFADLYKSLSYDAKIGKINSKENERAIKSLEKRTLELEKRHNIRKESKEPFFEELIDE